MECPACNEVMVVLEYDEVEVDYCVACGGIWLDAGELELLFGDRKLTEGFLNAGSAAARTAEKARLCPICFGKMKKRSTGGAAPVTYDFCRRGDGMWFDQGELGAVLEQGSPAPGGEAVCAWLREMFSATRPGTPGE